MTEEEKKEQTPKERLEELFVAFEIINQLNMFPRFRDFINLNYDIAKNKDPETGDLTLSVMEVLPEEVGRRMRAAAQQAMKQEMEEIKVASPDDLKKLLGK